MESGSLADRKAQREARQEAKAKASGKGGTATQVKPNPTKQTAEQRRMARIQAELEPGTTAKANANATSKSKSLTVWALGKFTVEGFEVLAIKAGPLAHNELEAQSKSVNEEAGTRVAFIVDAGHLPTSIPMVNEFFTAQRLVGDSVS